MFDEQVGQNIELIETLWNVNDIDVDFETERRQELIETLWNVNFTQFKVVESKKEN